ncbi:MAG TPA: DUF4123 domain-containing protein [Gammaproteobacteria bacterium]|nr:DUF4123 domain-containing protein [Gammaproteobacteria bacterium]HRF45095.1 DUF4123 domain-containing protein [Candidatus Competibacteraceae bacterium]
MPDVVLINALSEHLSALPETTIYAVLDGASVPNLPQMLERLSVESVCLFPGELEPDVAQVAAYLAVFKLDTPFSEWVLEEGWGRHWGIFAISQANLRTVRDHLRSFLKVYGPALEPLEFRYYDPRVLRVYLPTCNAKELRTVFGPVLRYLAEGEESNILLKFSLDGEQLRSEPVVLA